MINSSEVLKIIDKIIEILIAMNSSKEIKGKLEAIGCYATSFLLSEEG